ncbi:hypothetical protein FisN_22Lh226 [Fistulifera solaris]|uniref:PHD-type domain-containing protein n=1 Tax=Fistulifera solaris TaxID=1519565 RepID=A0A1Z5JBZ4_FISSO|nr:hypothetical protein FisN_22Lh226 [Fistulifera solaris]|eukprot:GAX11534.1 hypothetical protein FisN_22Lh226 [Fistulifera solaris]
MGRPSLTETSARRPTTRSENEEEETFPRRFPRTGNLFQVKSLPAINPSYRSEREIPLLMSSGVPYCTMDEQSSGCSGEQKTTDRTLGSPWSSSFSSCGPSELNVADSKFPGLAFPFTFAESEISDRVTDVDAATTTPATTIVTRRESSKKSTSDEIDLSFDSWVKAICKWQGEQQISINQSQPRRKAHATKKRARPDDDELPLPKRAAILDNNDGKSWQLVWSQFVALSGGRMCFARRHKAKPRSWKDLLEPVAILGDLRSESTPPHLHHLKVHIDNAEDVWQAILALCEVLVTQLKQPSEQRPIYLSQVMRLLDYCNQLPDPEDVFVAQPHDTTIKDIYEILDLLLAHVETARSHQARLLDLWYQKGADVDELRKRLDILMKESPLQLDEVHELKSQTDAVMKWQVRLENGFESTEDAEALVREGETLGFESRGLLQLRSRISKVYEIRESVREWRLSGRKESTKFLANLVREIQRVRCPFEEAQEVLSLQQESESWIDRASIAIRTKLSLQEMDDLVKRGEALPLDLSEFIDKLSTRISLGKSWLERFMDAVQQPESDPSQSPSLHMYKWMQNIRLALNPSAEDGDTVVPTLHELASEGGRLPVQVDCVQLLQIEIEAKSWSARARKWDSKRPKLDELQEHVSKATNLRERLTILNSNERDSWQLEGEVEVRKLVAEVETWLERYDSLSEKSWSLEDLRVLARDAETIPANLGTASSQLNKVLNQAEDWYKQNEPLIRCCQNGDIVDVIELRAAVESANGDLMVELDEVLHLQRVLDQVSDWMNKASIVSGGKRKGKKFSISIDELEELIKQADLLPVNTSDEVDMLLKEIDISRKWQTVASESLMTIARRFDEFRLDLLQRYGSPELYDRKKIADVNGTMKGHDSAAFRDPVDLQLLVEEFHKDAVNMVVATPESTLAPTLEAIGRWCIRSQKYLESQRDVFDKRFFGAFDRFITEGKSFCDCSTEHNPSSVATDAIGIVKSAFSSVVRDQLERLSFLSKDREDFIRWSKTAEAAISSGEKKTALEKLKDISLMGAVFPSECELVERLQTIVDEAMEWTSNISELLSSGEKISMAEARSLCDEAEKIGFVSSEVKTLQNEIKAARAWSNQVKRSNIEQGSVQARNVQSLIEEHESLLIHMPEELTKLKHAVKNYCICRRPYEGFMIGCDDCGEWFHVGCVGVTETKANKVDKYTCVRCSALQSYKACAASVASTIKKWTSVQELKRARQVLAQKHQRRVRKETKQIETLALEKKELLGKLRNFASEISVLNETTEDIVTNESPLEASTRQDPTLSTSKEQVGTKTFNEDGAPPKPDAVANNILELGKEQIASRLQIIDENLELCKSRLVKLEEDLNVEKEKYREEDQSAQLLKKWSIRVRSIYLAPTTEERALASRPALNSELLSDLTEVCTEASDLGLTRFDEVVSTHDALARLAWTFRVLIILARRPSTEEMAALVKTGKSLKGLDDKALRVMRLLKKTHEKAEMWQTKVAKALAPIPGESRNFDMNNLRELLRAADDIPLNLPFESRLATVIEDKGVRHCVCGGPSDGRFMLCCDRCSKWYHGQCLNISKDSVDEDAEWKCPECLGAKIDISMLDLARFHETFEIDTEMEDTTEDQDDVSSKAPDLDTLWPPLGLLGSEKAKEALGEACCSIPDNVGFTKETPLSMTSQSTGDNAQLTLSREDTVTVMDTTVSHAAPIMPATMHNSTTSSSTPTDENWLQRVLSVHNSLPLASATMTPTSFGNVEEIAVALRLQQAVPTLYSSFPGGVSNHGMTMPSHLHASHGGHLTNNMMVHQPVVSATPSAESVISLEQRLALLAGRDPIDSEVARQHEILVNALSDARRDP